MPAAAIGINHHGGRALEHGVRLRPAVGVNFDLNAGDGLEAFLPEQNAGAEFVIARSVAHLAGDEEDAFVGGFGGNGGEQSECEECG